jgi:hypothetical protein
MAGTRDVFINCPFDLAYKPLFYAITFSVIRSGFTPRCAIEVDDSAQVRLVKIENIIEECRYGIHDLSRTEPDGSPPLPRFNMPLELGVFLGARRFGDATQRRKHALILDTERYRYQKFISDVAGQDIHAHDGNPAKAAREVATWLRQQSKSKSVPGGAKIAQEFTAFQTILPALLDDRQLVEDEVTFGDFADIARLYIDTL